MQLNNTGLELIKSFEDCKLTAYRDGGGVLTIGWGRTKNVKVGDTITQEQADNYLHEEIENEYAADVARLVKVTLNENQFAALVSFHYNTGALAKSTLLKRLNAGDYAAAANELLRWDKDNGKRVAGLTRRRKAERELFLKPV